MGAMSLTWAERPSGACAIRAFSRSDPMIPPVRTFGLDHAWVDAVDADLSGAKLTRPHAGEGIERPCWPCKLWSSEA